MFPGIFDPEKKETFNRMIDRNLRSIPGKVELIFSKQIYE